MRQQADSPNGLVDAMIAHLYPMSKRTQAERRRLAFARYLAESGRISEFPGEPAQRAAPTAVECASLRSAEETSEPTGSPQSGAPLLVWLAAAATGVLVVGLLADAALLAWLSFQLLGSLAGGLSQL